MPGMNDDQRDDLEDEDEGLEDEDSNEESEDNEDQSNDQGSAKRIADLQSKFDKAEARANKAEKALSMRGDGSTAGSNDPATRALMSELREAALDAVFGEYAELRDYGIDRSIIEGTTRAELRENASVLVSLIKNVSTKARNKALAEAGVKPEAAGNVTRGKKSAADLSDDEFLKMLDSIS